MITIKCHLHTNRLLGKDTNEIVYCCRKWQKEQTKLAAKEVIEALDNARKVLF